MTILIWLFTLTSSFAVTSADKIWMNGKVLTMNDEQPSAEAIAIYNGRILAVGERKSILKLKGPKTEVHDLEGNTLIPGFVDAHGHVSLVGLQAVSANLLPPPDGPNKSIAKLQQTLSSFLKTSKNPEKFGLLIGFGYDDSQLEEMRHPTRSDLDKVSKNIPILIIHQSGHLGVLNSRALEKVGLSAESQNPPGGRIRRAKDSQEPDGVLEENAFFAALTKILPSLDGERGIALLEAGQKLYSQYGYTTVQDGRTNIDQIKVLKAAAEQGRLITDVVSYPDVLTPDIEKILVPPLYHNTKIDPIYWKHARIGGVKLTLDGSPQGKTAWLSKPYFKPPEGEEKSYAGYRVVSDEKAQESYEKALKNHWQILTHANGDRAIDEMLQTFGKAKAKYPKVNIRPVLIHGQTLRKDQIPPLQMLGIFPSLFPMHTFYWGDWHRRSVLGEERAQNISPTGWLLKENMKFTTHHDAPVAHPNSVRVLSATVTRTTRSGMTLGAEHKVPAETALKAMTIWAAYQHFEEKSKGSLEKGKLADFAILSSNPLEIPEEELIDLKVLETIKEGKTIFRYRVDPLRQARIK